MNSLDTVLDAFLEEQNNQLKPKTYRDYEEVIQFFQLYLNQYAPNMLTGQEKEKWEARFPEDEECYTKMFGPEKLTSGDFADFLDYFMIRKVMSSESLLKAALKVLKKLNKWLYDNHYFDQQTYQDLQDYFAEAKDLPDVERLSDMIFDFAEQTPDLPFDDVQGDYFSVEVIKKGELWVMSEFQGDQTIGPLRVPTQISDLCKEGWNISMEIGKYQGEWYILESGNVYRL